MKTSGTGRVLAAGFMGAMSGIYLHFRELRDLSRGRDAFLSAQGHRFDRIMQFHSAVSMLIAGVILVAVAVGVYELIAAGFTRLVPPTEVEE